MESRKTKSLQGIEQKMEGLDRASLRYHVLESARNFKASWIELGRSLYSVWKDKLYKEWGYGTFDAYTAREIGIRKQTSMKLLKSYYFLEQEEPEYLKRGYGEPGEAAVVPSYESINMLRLAKNKKVLDREDYINLKKDIFEKGKDAPAIRKDLTAIMRQREELEPEEAWQRKKLSTVKRFLSTLKSLKQEIEISKLLPASIIKEAASLIHKLETELS
ncbi:MAG: hypothetical protein ABIG46_05865 [Candidatus Omnitrophota bacterium]|nr:hypothetical protein [Candidatus Omnitrophota bacterium]